MLAARLHRFLRIWAQVLGIGSRAHTAMAAGFREAVVRPNRKITRFGGPTFLLGWQEHTTLHTTGFGVALGAVTGGGTFCTIALVLAGAVCFVLTELVRPGLRIGEALLLRFERVHHRLLANGRQGR